MAKFNFPTSPSTNQTYTANSVTWKWNGHAWKRTTGVGAPTGPQDADLRSRIAFIEGVSVTALTPFKCTFSPCIG